MSTRRHVLLYEPEFAALVITGRKRCTIRSRARVPKPGDLLDHRAWHGVPYRPGSRQTTILTSACTRVRVIEIDSIEGLIWIGEGFAQELLTANAADELARTDGFRERGELIDYFRDKSGLPFHGVVIEWKP